MDKIYFHGPDRLGMDKKSQIYSQIYYLKLEEIFSLSVNFQESNIKDCLTENSKYNLVQSSSLILVNVSRRTNESAESISRNTTS